MKYLFLTLLLINSLEAATTLKESFQAALLNMETIKRSHSEIRQAIERKNQARAGLLPTVSAFANETRIDRPKASGVNQAFILTRQYSTGLRLQQPLLRGGIFAGLQSRNEEILLTEFQKNATEISLFQLVISSYYDLHFAQKDIKNLAELLKYSQERVKELKAFTNVGRSRKAELAQAQTQLLNAEVQFKQGEMALVEALRTFEFYTGLEGKDLAPLALIPKDLPSLTEYMEKLKSRPDILARRQEVRVAEERMEVSKGGHYPAVDLVGNYYFDRTGVLQTSEWDVAVVVSVPLYQGGAVVSQVREASEAKRVAVLNSEETIRAARRDLATLYQNYHLMQSQLDILKDALNKSEESYRLNLKDYRNGLVTNLEVLQSLNVFIENKRSYDNLITLSHQAYKNIEASIGVLP